MSSRPINNEVRKSGIKVKCVGALETNRDKYGNTHIAVLYKYKETILGWPTTGTKAYFEPHIGKTHKITFNELSNEFLDKITSKDVARISYVKYI